MESPVKCRRGFETMKLGSPETSHRDLRKGSGEATKQMKIVSSASSPLKRKHRDVVQGLENVRFSGMGFMEEQRKAQQREAFLVEQEKARIAGTSALFEKGRQMAKRNWGGKARDLAEKGKTVVGNVTRQRTMEMKSPVQTSMSAGTERAGGMNAPGENRVVNPVGRQYLHSSGVSPLVKAMSETAKLRKRVVVLEAKLDTNKVEALAMARRMKRLEVLMDALQAEMGQNGTGRRYNLDSW
jgi:hypothetical protein